MPKNSQTPNSNFPDVIEVTIDRLSYNGGRGVGRYQGMVTFVPDTAPGDVVKARIILQKSNLLEAELVEIIERSPHRREPPCPVAGICGGCSWQHVNYDEQLKQKQEILDFALRGIKVGEILPIIPAPSEWRYRNRIQVHALRDKLGFFAKRSQTIAPIEDCLIADEKLIPGLKQIRTANPSSMKRVEVALSLDGQVNLDWEERSSEESTFAQVNQAQNEKLVAHTISEVPPNARKIADLYAGYGNISIPLARAHPNAKVVAVELSRSNVKRGEGLARDLTNLEFIADDVERFVRRQSQGFDAIILDPPRNGCSNATVMSLEAPRLIYVSCNPTTFARDAKKLEERGYSITKVLPIDMFPQTEHIELIATLIK